MPEAGWYYRLSQFFKEKLGRRVYKLPVSAGFSCPNRDGTLGFGGCTFCYNPGFSPSLAGRDETLAPVPVREQLDTQKITRQKRFPEAGFLAYFQSYTNTYSSREHLHRLYDEALAVDGVVGLAVATRPDCVSLEVLDLLEDYARNYHVWLEYGLQSAHDRTLEIINRGHDCRAFIDAVEATKGRGIHISAHVILGLPGETREQMLATVRLLNGLALDGVKFHHLQVLRNTVLAEEYARGEVTTLSVDQYVSLACDLLETLSPRMVVHRLVGEVLDSEFLLAPRWEESKTTVIQAIEHELKKRNAYQGCKF